MDKFNLFSFYVLVLLNWLSGQIIDSHYLPLLAVGNMEDILIEEKIMPDIVEKVPTYIAEITYNNATVASFGNKIPKHIYKNKPQSVRWFPDCQKYYTLIFTDADANPKWPHRERQVWIIGNIIGGSYGKGDNLTDYAISEPAKDSGKHKIVSVIFEHDDKIDFKEPKISKPNDARRDNFSTVEFEKKYNFVHPNAANFFSIEYEGH